METLMNWAKENYDLISLSVGFLGVVIAVISFCFELKRRRERKTILKQDIEKKEAQLHAMEMSLKAGFNVQEYGSLDMQTNSLRAEIEQLKKHL